MKKLILSLIIFNFSFCSAQSWQWGVQGTTISNNPSEEGWSLARDHTGNLYLTGFLHGELVLGTDTLNSAFTINSSYCAYLVKYDSNGNVKWARQSVGQTQQEGIGVVVDKAGNVYMAGLFYDTAYLGSARIAARKNILSVFLAKYDSSGNLLWVRQSDGILGNGAQLYGVAMDGRNNVYMTGSINGSIAFGPYILQSHGCFLVKYDSSGNVMWATTPPRANGIGWSVAADSIGNSYITGLFADTMFVGRDTLTGNSTYFLAKYNSSGHGVWAVQAYGGSRGYSVAIDSAGYIYSTGYYLGNTVIGTDTLLQEGNYGNLFLARYDSGGNNKWVRYPTYNRITPNSGCFGLTLSTDKLCNVYVIAGNFDSLSVNVKFGNINLVLNNGRDIMALVEYDSSGNANCGSILASGGDDQSGFIAEPSGYAVYFGGDLEDTVTFGSDHIGSLGNETICLAKWKTCNAITTVQNLNNETPEPVVYPNPSSGQFIFQSSVAIGQSLVEIYNLLGEKVYSQFTLHNSPFTINLSDKPSGIYLYRVTKEDGGLIGEGKIVIER